MKKMMLLLALWMSGVLLLSGGSVLAAENGVCGENLTWSLEDGVLTIQGTGPMERLASWTGQPWRDSRGSITAAVIGDGVTEVSDYAFFYCRELKSLALPDSLTKIGQSAFAGCENLPELTIPDSITGIGPRAFAYCGGLTGITLPDSLTEVPDWAFFRCAALTGAELPAGVTRVGDHAFSGCAGLTKLGLPEGLTEIGNWAFAESGLTEAVFPAGLRRIGDRAFDSGEQFGAVRFGGAMAQWEQVFLGADNTALTRVNQQCADGGIEGMLDSGTCVENLTWYLNTAGVLRIQGTGSMDDWNNSIGPPWYENRTIIESVIIDNGVTNIGDWAFSDCRSLTEITIQNTVTKIAQISLSY